MYTVSCDECVYTWRYHSQLDWGYFCDLEGQQSLPDPWASKIKMAFCTQKNHVSHWMDKIIYEAVFKREKNDVLYL